MSLACQQLARLYHWSCRAPQGAIQSHCLVTLASVVRLIRAQSWPQKASIPCQSTYTVGSFPGLGACGVLSFFLSQSDDENVPGWRFKQTNKNHCLVKIITISFSFYPQVSDTGMFSALSQYFMCLLVNISYFHGLRWLLKWKLHC